MLRRRFDSFRVAPDVAHMENELLSFLQAQFLEAIAKAIDRCRVRAAQQDNANSIDTRLLRMGGERRCQKNACGDEKPPASNSPHALPRPQIRTLRLTQMPGLRSGECLD